MAILPIYVYDNPVLRRKAKPIRQVDEELVRLAENMFETMYNANGIGLAANQVGSLQRIIVIDSSTSENDKEGKRLVLLNPRVVEESGSVSMEEGCLSLPDLRDEVDRAERVTVRYRDLAFQEQEITAEGLLGRVLLHEIDHLNGVLFIDHLGMVRRKILTGRLNRMKRGEAEASYPTVGARLVPEEPGTVVEKKLRD